MRSILSAGAGMLAIAMGGLGSLNTASRRAQVEQLADDATVAEIVIAPKPRRASKPVASTVSESEPVSRPVSRQVRRRVERLAKKRGY